MVPKFKKCKKLEKTELKNCFVKNLEKYLSKKNDYPQNNPTTDTLSNKVFASFEISIESSVYKVNVKARVTDADIKLELEEKAKKILKELPKLELGIHRDKTVNVGYSLYLYFPKEEWRWWKFGRRKLWWNYQNNILNHLKNVL